MSNILERFKQKLDTFTISDYHGLSSPGLTCYLNSVLQVLFMTVDYREAVKSRKDSTTIDSHLQRLFTDLERRMATTLSITQELNITNVFKQRDAAEYFEKILSLSGPEASKIFKGELKQTTTCLKCRERDESRSWFWLLPLSVEESVSQTYSVKNGLKGFFKRQMITGDDKVFCNRCKKKQDTGIVCEITQYPDVLTILLKRFTFDLKRQIYIKLHSKVDVPHALSLESYTYDLYAVVNHSGNLTGGHYTSKIKSFENGEWYWFNDNTVKKMKPVFGPGRTEMRSSTAYLLMYRKAVKVN